MLLYALLSFSIRLNLHFSDSNLQAVSHPVIHFVIILSEPKILRLVSFFLSASLI